MRLSLVCFSLALFAAPLPAQAPGKFPPDSLINVKVIPKGTPVVQVVGMMRNFTGGLGVRCQFCHVGEEGMPLGQFDFAKDEKKTKLVARQMMRMVEEINKRLDTIPGRAAQGLQVSCSTCHRGVNKPTPLFQVVAEATVAAGADSAIRAYKALRERFYGRDAYDFGEGSLNAAAFRVARANKVDDALALLKLNEEQFPNSSGMYVFRGNIVLLRGDTTSAATAYREAIRRDSTNNEARGRLRDIGRAQE
ncbi:MAG: c-type cytochrome [Gemmatimonadetes bacterium]|nr:c-type cytochrome [Gemmatimonadota bacterium]